MTVLLYYDDNINVILRWIGLHLGSFHLPHTRLAVAFSRLNFLLFFSSKTIKNPNVQMRRLYAYAANESAFDNVVAVLLK